MELQLKSKERCMYDELSLGEVMLRLDQAKVESELQEDLKHQKVVENIMLLGVWQNALALEQQ